MELKRQNLLQVEEVIKNNKKNKKKKKKTSAETTGASLLSITKSRLFK